jgi:hypothetical protein
VVAAKAPTLLHHGALYSLILRSAKRVSKDEATNRASWFETREDALLTMRGY